MSQPSTPGDGQRGSDYEARCSHWESLTDADIWGPAGRPPLPQLPPEQVAS